MTSAPTVRVSPRHRVTIDEDYLPMLAKAPREDFVVRTLAQRAVGETPLMSAELVIAGASTRERYPLAERYPLHFRKTYYPGKLHADPHVELERHRTASTLIGVFEPIGCTRSSFRSCLIPGTPLDRISELGVEPPAANIQIARRLPLAMAVGLWRLAEQAYALLAALQAGGMTHGDAHLHNFIVCPSPLEVLPVDFELAIVRDSVDEATWRRRTEADRAHLLRFGVFLMCALGRQEGRFGEEAMARLDALVKPASDFLGAIAERSYAAGPSELTGR